MPRFRWLAAASLAAGALVGPAAQADLIGRAFRRSEARAERLEGRAERTGLRDREPASFVVANEGEIGKFIRPVTFQSLPAPSGAAGPTLAPVPDPYPGGLGDAPAPLAGPSTGSNFAPPGFAPSYGEPYPLPSGPVPQFVTDGGPIAGPIYPVGPGFEGVPLFERVKYEDLDHIHPCGVPVVVQVLDPCAPADPCAGCGPRCVYVKICVPPNERPRIKVERHGRKVKYKFDDYQVEVESKNGYVLVDYDD